MDRIALADRIERQVTAVIGGGRPLFCSDVEWREIIAALRTADPARPSVEAVARAAAFDDAAANLRRWGDNGVTASSAAEWLTLSYTFSNNAALIRRDVLGISLEEQRALIAPAETPAREPEATSQVRPSSKD